MFLGYFILLSSLGSENTVPFFQSQWHFSVSPWCACLISDKFLEDGWLCFRPSGRKYFEQQFQEMVGCCAFRLISSLKGPFVVFVPQQQFVLKVVFWGGKVQRGVKPNKMAALGASFGPFHSQAEMNQNCSVDQVVSRCWEFIFNTQEHKTT